MTNEKKQLALPTTKTPKKTKLEEYTVLLYGIPKIGKTTFLSRINDILFLASDPGLNNVEVYQVPINTWEELLEYGRLLRINGHNYKAVAIDTLDSTYKMCIDYICKKHGMLTPSDSHGGWGLVNNELMRGLMAFARLPIGFFMTAHTKELTFKSKVGVETTQIVMNLPDGARKIVEGWIDIILHCDIEMVPDSEEYHRIMKASVNLDGTGSSRITLPEKLPLNYYKFKEIFDIAVKERDAKDAERETTEKVSPAKKPATAKTTSPPARQQAPVPAGAGSGIKASCTDHKTFIT